MALGPPEGAWSRRRLCGAGATGLLLVLLITALYWSRTAGSLEVVSWPDRPAVAEGDVAWRHEDLHHWEPSRPVADPDRIEATLQVGRTYLVRAKGGFVVPATHVDYHGRRRTVNLAYAFETVFSRTIEQNDGQRVVELRRFGGIWAVALLSAEDLALDLGPPGEPLLQTLAPAEPHEGNRRVVPRLVAEAILPNAPETVAADAAAQAFWDSDSLSGKTVRLTYVDGVGVESIQPLGCTLNWADRNFLFLAPALWHGYALSGSGSNAPDGWSIDATQLMELMPPAMSRLAKGKILVRGDPDARPRGGRQVNLQIVGAATQPPGGAPFSPTGRVQFDLRDGLAATAALSWRAGRDCLTRLHPSVDHVLHKLQLHQQPTVSFRYRCHARPVRPGGAPMIVASRELGRFRGTRGDVIAGVLTLLASSIVLFWWGATIARDLSARHARCAVLATVALIVVFGVAVHGTLLPAEYLPFSNAVVLGNWLPLGASLLSGIVARARSVPLWRRALCGLVLVVLGWCTVLGHSPSPPKISRGRFQDGVCLQTSSVSCGPSCAVTLLHCHGIEASEREMTELCLTNRTGTSLLGLYRGLKLKTRDTRWDVDVVRGGIEELLSAEQYPLIVSVRLEPEPPPTAGQNWTGPLRLLKSRHTIVLLGISGEGRPTRAASRATRRGRHRCGR